MATNIPLTGEFRVTCEYYKKGNWACGHHTGIDLVGDEKIYSSCDGKVVRTGYDKSYGNFIVVKNSLDGKYHWFCHLSKIKVNVGQTVLRTNVIGIMGSTGNSTGKHLHFEIRNESNSYGDNSNPADYMGIPNKVGSYNSADYKVDEDEHYEPVLKTLARNTNLRSEPNTGASATLYLKNTTLYVLKPGVAQNAGYTWDKVKIRVNGKEGYMINKNYK